MKSFIVVALLVAAAAAAPAGPESQAKIVAQDLDNIGVEGYRFRYETENGIAAQEQGQIQNPGTQDEGIEVTGSFQYVGVDGVVYQVTYKAGKDGFQPQGAHIPQAA